MIPDITTPEFLNEVATSIRNTTGQESIDFSYLELLAETVVMVRNHLARTLPEFDDGDFVQALNQYYMPN